MVRVARPGGLVWLSWTTWLSPWGGHETSPWHYLGGRRAADRYARRHGRRPKNDFGRSLFAVSAAADAAAGPRAERGRPGAASTSGRATTRAGRAGWRRCPGVREVASWNVVIVMRRR